MGGTDEPENLVELTPAEHAEAHRLLYEQFGDERDKLAYQGLLGMIDKEDIIRQLQFLGGKKGGQTVKEKWNNEELNETHWSSTNFALNPDHQRKAIEARKQPASRKKHKQTLKEKFANGYKTHNSGKRMINNGTTHRYIGQNEPIEPGWKLGGLTYKV